MLRCKTKKSLHTTQEEDPDNDGFRYINGLYIRFDDSIYNCSHLYLIGH